MNRNKLYIFLSGACILGYAWLITDLTCLQPYEKSLTSVCIVKNVTGVPCPSCGSTRSVIALIKGDLQKSLYWNPLGLLLSLILVITPFWLVYDVLQKKDSLFRFYLKSESFIRKKYIAFFAILLLIINWIWNIYKGL